MSRAAVLAAFSGYVLNVTVADGGSGRFGYDTGHYFVAGAIAPTSYKGKSIANAFAGSDNSFTFALADGVNDLGQAYFRRLTVQGTGGTAFTLDTSASSHNFYNLSRNEWVWTGLASDVWTSTGTHWIILE